MKIHVYCDMSLSFNIKVERRRHQYKEVYYKNNLYVNLAFYNTVSKTVMDFISHLTIINV